MNRVRHSIFMAVFALALLAGIFVVTRVPESHVVHSGDGALTVTGLTRTSQQIEVTVDSFATTGSPLLGFVYHVDPSDIPLDSTIVLSFARSAELGTLDAEVVYQWNSSLGMWIPLESVVADTKDTLAVEVMTLGDFVLGESPDVMVPTLLSLVDSLRAKAPVGTRGFRFVTSYRLPGGVPVAWKEAQVLGGCGGRVGAGDSVEYSSASQTVTVFVNDVQTPVDFTVVAEWTLSQDKTGCPASMPLKVQE